MILATIGFIIGWALGEDLSHRRCAEEKVEELRVRLKHAGAPTLERQLREMRGTCNDAHKRMADVVESRVHGWQRFQGKSIEEALGRKNGQQAIPGYINGNPVTAGGDKNYIENVFEMGNGKMRIQVRETVDFGTDTKIDPVKGIVHGVTMTRGRPSRPQPRSPCGWKPNLNYA